MKNNAIDNGQVKFCEGQELKISEHPDLYEELIKNSHKYRYYKEKIKELESKVAKLNLEMAASKLQIDRMNKNLESASMVLNHLKSNTKFIHHDYEEYFIAMTNCLGTLLDCMKEETE